MIISGGLSGGISSSIAGGDFGQGMLQGLITSGLNHVTHYIGNEISDQDKGKSLLCKIGYDVGDQVLDPEENTTLNSIKRFFIPREVEKDGFRFRVDASGKVVMMVPLGGAGALGLISTGGLGYATLTATEMKALIATETIQGGAQSVEKINFFKEAIKNGDYLALYSNQITLYVYKGKSYILDGHHRIQAAISSNKKLEVIILNTEKAIQKFGSKLEEIHKGWHK